ncbi:MAG: carbohydrate kinase family protein [Candidatus Bipolaricaulota bacterium]|nr:carbohydrate kinase family protein [Candidatus Bipolaricaulota bacterium]
MSRILILGDINLDVLADVPVDLPVDGEVRTRVVVEPGGSAANFARAAARVGAAVEFIGCVGDDLVGDILVESLNGTGVIPHLQRTIVQSGTIVSLKSNRGKTMLCSRGANDMIDPSLIDEGWFAGADHLHLSGYTFLSEVQRAAAKRAISIAQLHKMSISIDPPPANLISSYGVQAFLAEISAAGIVFPNLEEGRNMTDEDAPEEIVDSLSVRFPVGALSMGRDGSIAWDGKKRSVQHVAGIDGVDPTGAGDAFAAVFMVSYLANHDLEQANSAGSAAARNHLLKRAHDT